MELDAATCYRAICAHDERFDGVFFVGVTTTGVYCRPVCRARTPGEARCRYFRSAVEAEAEGFRACFRCRPELAPGYSATDAVDRLAKAALARIEAGALNEGSLDDLAAELGVTGRHVRRAVRAVVGASPVAVAQSRRMALAKQLLQDTALSMADVAFASGFASVRRFNARFSERFGRPPSALRREHRAGWADAGITLRLDYRPPLDWDALLAFFAARATAGVEVVAGDAYRRTVRLGRHTGWVSVAPDRARPALRATVSTSLLGALMPLIARLRRLFDLDARPDAIAAVLGRDARLGPILARHPGLRLPGALDGFEAAARVVLGQQVSVRGATTIAGRLGAAFGEPVDTGDPSLTRLAPTPEALVEAGAERIAAHGMPGSRARTLVALAQAAVDGRLRLAPGTSIPEAMAVLQALPGVGPWTAEVVGMRLGWPDAFPASDLGIVKALGGLAPAEAEAWRPWRAYAAVALWTDQAETPGARR